MKKVIFAAIALLLLIITLFDGIDDLTMDPLKELGALGFLMAYLNCALLVVLFLGVINWLKIK